MDRVVQNMVFDVSTILSGYASIAKTIAREGTQNVRIDSKSTKFVVFIEFIIFPIIVLIATSAKEDDSKSEHCGTEQQQ